MAYYLLLYYYFLIPHSHSLCENGNSILNLIVLTSSLVLSHCCVSYTVSHASLFIP